MFAKINDDSKDKFVYSCAFMNDVQIIAQRTSKENPKKDQLFLIVSVVSSVVTMTS